MRGAAADWEGERVSSTSGQTPKEDTHKYSEALLDAAAAGE